MIWSMLNKQIVLKKKKQIKNPQDKTQTILNKNIHFLEPIWDLTKIRYFNLQHCIPKHHEINISPDLDIIFSWCKLYPDPHSSQKSKNPKTSQTTTKNNQRPKTKQTNKQTKKKTKKPRLLLSLEFSNIWASMITAQRSIF